MYRNDNQSANINAEYLKNNKAWRTRKTLTLK